MTGPCPSLSELFAEQPSTYVLAHAESCGRCRSLLRSNTVRLPVQGAAAGVEAVEREADAKAGAVVRVAASGSDERLIAVLADCGDETASVVPLSGEIELATEWDILLAKDDLGYRSMAEVWNHGVVLREQVEDELATLPGEIFELLRRFLTAAATGAEKPAGVAVGPPVVGDDDPRLVFHDEEAERVHVYWEPVLALAGAANVAQLVEHRRAELALDRDQLESVSMAERGWLELLEHDDLPIVRTLTPQSFASLMSRLRLGASRRLARILASTLEQQAESPIETGSVLARRRRASTATEASVDTYVESVMSELKRLDRG